MSAPWQYAGAPDPVGDQAVTLMEGTTFCISDVRGDIGTVRPGGLFVRDTRVLSRWLLSIDDRRIAPLRRHHQWPHQATFIALASNVTAESANDLVLTRTRFVGDGLREDLVLRNTGREPVQVHLSLQVDADFADLFEVKEDRAVRPAGVRVVASDGSVDLSLERDGEEFGVTVAAPGATTGPSSLHWSIDLGAHDVWSTSLDVVPRLRGRRLVPHHRSGAPPEHAAPARRREQFRSSALRLATDDADLVDVLEHSLEDLATLRIFDPERPGLPVIAAGAPWFMALFGRDSLLTSMMLMPVDAGLTVGTLTTLGAHQGTRVDPVTEEQPGRILHELRFGPAGTLALGGQNAYYGTADATPLFVVAAGELHRWHPSLVSPELVAQVDRALDWIIRSGVGDGSGFLEYQRGTEQGLANQGWKDSWDGINFADGTIAEAPIALAEVQAYTFAAFRARARIAAASGDSAAATRWRERAATLKASFDAAFWLPERGWYAVGLDRDHRPIDALTSNTGHCLWAGIVPEERAGQVVDRLMSPDMFTGWGIRTLGADMGAYNPMSYHNGSVWPHDTALCVAGMARYGFTAEARRVTVGMLDAAREFGGRLPELFAGFTRADCPVPVPYPAACTPQAWAAAAPAELLRALLRLEPRDDTLTCDPALPAHFLPLSLRNVQFRGRRFDVDVDHDRWDIRPVDTTG
jgi:glycogen debranching enzyme